MLSSEFCAISGGGGRKHVLNVYPEFPAEKNPSNLTAAHNFHKMGGKQAPPRNFGGLFVVLGFSKK